MVQDVTSFYETTAYQNIYLIGDGDGEIREVTLMSDLELSLNDIRVKSELVITQDREQLASLIDQCSILISKINS